MCKKFADILIDVYWKIDFFLTLSRKIQIILSGREKQLSLDSKLIETQVVQYLAKDKIQQMFTSIIMSGNFIHFCQKLSKESESFMPFRKDLGIPSKKAATTIIQKW